MVKYLVVFILCIYPVCSFSQHDFNKINKKIVNWGFRAGVNAITPGHYEVLQEDATIEDITANHRTGYLATIFFRINLDNFYMQPELSYYQTKETISYTSVNALTSRRYDVDSKAYSFNLCVLPGYNVVKTGPFLLSLFVGPNFKYTYRQNYTVNGYGKFNTTPEHYNINLTSGLSINISNLLVDFRYEINFPNSNVNFGEIPESPDFLKGLEINKNENRLSFSFGLMF